MQGCIKQNCWPQDSGCNFEGEHDHRNCQHYIDTGDYVHHAPSDENWVVAYVQGDRLAWCGWPEGEARLRDCTLVEKTTPEKRLRLLQEMAAMPGQDARKRYAQQRLVEMAPATVSNGVTIQHQ